MNQAKDLRFGIYSTTLRSTSLRPRHDTTTQGEEMEQWDSNNQSVHLLEFDLV
jgi:hypothetical protein